MPSIVTDFYGHLPPTSNGSNAALAGASSGTAAGTIVFGAGASAISGVAANDTAGTFVLTAAAAAGVYATVYFANPYANTPKAVLVQAVDTTGAAAVTTYVTALGVGSFVINGPSTTSGHSVSVYYEVIA